MELVTEIVLDLKNMERFVVVVVEKEELRFVYDDDKTTFKDSSISKIAASMTRDAIEFVTVILLFSKLKSVRGGAIVVVVDVKLLFVVDGDEEEEGGNNTTTHALPVRT